MSQTRRSFLTMMGAAAATPALPGRLSSLGPKLKALGVAHAKKFPLVSVLGISRRLGVSQDQARELIDYLATKGHIGRPVVPGTGLASAPSKLFKPITVKQSFAKRAADEARRRAERARAKVQTQLDATRLHPSVDWLAHLHSICERQSLALSPRALASVGGAA